MELSEGALKSMHLIGARDFEGKYRQGQTGLSKTQMGSFKALSEICRMWDPDTARHQRRVGQMAVSIAREMNLSRQCLEFVYVAGILHDIGKIAVPWEILTAPRRLTATEFLLMQAHPEAGYDILKSIGFPWPVSRVALEHHERINGSGYPFGRRGEELLLESKIVAVADVVEAMSSPRHYRGPLDQGQAMEEITINRSILYEGRVVDACVRFLQGSSEALYSGSGSLWLGAGLSPASQEAKPSMADLDLQSGRRACRSTIRVQPGKH